ncbi:hypothetical protein ILUMI_15719 [Ignelater luminosus]|uniref:Uncharacterized protein n=1 Tax=Ignelater luminosus TaxID=2038154 RepID=A0A8K0CN26_IGNLU|nr:hypothetical protein ILUMI_15719 [Ignelater luminosus]
MPNTENTSFGQNPSTSTTTIPDTDYGAVEQNPSTSAMNMSDTDNATENASILSHGISVAKTVDRKLVTKFPEEITKIKKKKEIIYSSSENKDENVFITDESESEVFDEDDIISLDRNFETEDFVAVKFDTEKDIEDIGNVSIDDIKTKLPAPTISTKFKRGTTKYTFDKPLWVLPNLK